MLSIVVPCYNEEENINCFYNSILNTLLSFCNNYEIIFVDDGSSDKTIDKIKFLNKKDNNVKFISLSRNFGKEASILAGLEKAKGNYIVLMDVDLQDPVNLLPQMYKAVKFDGYDIVRARRISRKGEPVLRSLCANLFYFFVRNFLKINLKNGIRDYCLMKRDVLNSLLSLREKNRFLKALFPWLGYKTKVLEYENIERVAGYTKWSFFQLVLYSIDGIFAFSDVPLLFISVCGIVLFLLSIIIAICLLITKGVTFEFLMAAFVIIFWGIQMIFFSVLAQYISKIYNETKNRPHYLVREQSAE